jgi:predicted nucleotidyltransferase
VTSLSVGCSLGRGAADELSDIDAAIGVATRPGAAGVDQVREVEQALVDHLSDENLIDVLRGESLTGDLYIRRAFAQLRDGVQLDLAVVAEAGVRRGNAAPDFVCLYRVSDPVEQVTMPSAFDVSADDVRVWTFLGWRSLLDADKYLRRGSPWEAHNRLHEARHHIWALWATVLRTTYPQHGLSQILDQDPPTLPHGIEATVSHLDLNELRAAVQAAAAVLDQVSTAAAQRCAATLPTQFAAYVRPILSATSSRRTTRRHPR